MSVPRVVAVAPGSPAERAGVLVGDQIQALNGTAPRDVLEWRTLTDEAHLEVSILRSGLERVVDLDKQHGEPFGAEVHSALFDRVRTCDNHCSFCFIYQLPKGLRKSLYVKDDDYRLSFLYGNFTTLTRFTEADLERVVSEGLSPLHVSIHATDPIVRSSMLRNRRGATSLRWFRALLDHDVEVHGQIVVCPGQNDGAVLDDTLAGVLDQYPELASLCVVPLGLSRFNSEPDLRPHTQAELDAVIDAVEDWQEIYRRVLGHRLVFAADEYYLLAGRPFPSEETYEGFPMHEDGIGMVRAFEAEFTGATDVEHRPQSGFFQSVDGAPAEGYRAPRLSGGGLVRLRTGWSPTAILTSRYGSQVIEPLIAGRDGVRVVAVDNDYFGGNIAVTGLLVGEDLARVLAAQPEGDRYLLPDVCLSQGRFLDGTNPDELPRPVEIVPTSGAALRHALDAS